MFPTPSIFTLPSITFIRVERRLNIQALELAKLARHIIEDKKGTDIVILDMTGLTDVADYFVMATGTSSPHLKAMFEQVWFDLKKQGVPCSRKAGNSESGWMALDYYDVIIHFLTGEKREYYALEELWTKAKKVR